MKKVFLDTNILLDYGLERAKAEIAKSEGGRGVWITFVPDLKFLETFCF